MPAAEGGDADRPITRGEAETAYRRIRAVMFFSAAWFLALAIVVALLDFKGWQIYLAAIVLFEGIATPLFLRYFRRRLDERVRASEAALGRE